MMTLSWADRRLGAEEHDLLPMSGAAAVSASERAVDLQVVRPAVAAANAGAAAAPVTRWIDPHTQRGWGSSPEYEHRARRERQYCEQIRDARAEGRKPLSADEFFSRPTT